MNEGPSDAKQTLLRALEAIEDTEREMDANVRFLAVVYAVDSADDSGDIHGTLGYQHSSDPNWVIAALLKKGAELVEVSHIPEEE